jgi:hypothetical protein
VFKGSREHTINALPRGVQMENEIIYEYDQSNDSGKFFVIGGNVEKAFDLTTAQYIIRQHS